MKSLHTRAQRLKKKVVLPEGVDPRTIQAMDTIVQEEIARPVLLGNEQTIRTTAAEIGVTIPHTVPIIDPAQSEKASEYAQELFQLRKHKGMTYEEARETVQDVLYFGALMVRRDEVDGSVAGAAHPTPDGIFCASYAGRAGKGTEVPIYPPLMIPNRILYDLAGVNDGLVPLESAKWGDVLGILDADHARQIGLKLAPGAFDSKSFYLDVVRDLSARGL